MMRSVLLLATLLACAAIATQATKESGRVTSASGFAFLSKYCFHDEGYHPAGEVEIDIEVPMYSRSTLNETYDFQIAIYDDSDDSWPTILRGWDTMTCAQKVQNAGPRIQHVTSWSSDTNKLYIHYKPKPFQNAVRPRFWYFALANCKDGFTSVDYKFHGWQFDYSHWNEEFGGESTGLNTLYLVFFFLFTILVALHCYGTSKLQSRLSYLHPLLKLFLLVLLTEYLAVFLELIHYGSYPNNGEGVPALHTLGGVLSLVSRMLLITLLLLLAKGWTISKETLDRKWLVVGVLGSYLLLSIVRLVWEREELDPKQVDLPKSLLAIDIVLAICFTVFCLWFIYEIVFCSYAHEENPHKKSLYLRLALLYVPWMLLYLVVLFSVFALDAWVRERVVHVLSLGLAFLAQAALAFLFWPSRAEEYFSLAIPDIAQGVRGDEDYAHL